MFSKLRPALFFPVKKDTVGKGTLASVPLSEKSWCCVREEEKKMEKRNHTKHTSYSILLGCDASNITSEPAGTLDCALSIALALTPK